jgi:hypothetical protein
MRVRLFTLYESWVNMLVHKKPRVWGGFWGDNDGLCNIPTLPWGVFYQLGLVFTNKGVFSIIWSHLFVI